METLKNLDTISVPLLLLIMIVGTVMAFRIYGTAGLSANEVETPTMSMIEGIGTPPASAPRQQISPCPDGFSESASNPPP